MSQNIWINPFEAKEVEIDVCDRCDEEIEDGYEIHHPNGEDVCEYCVEDKEVAKWVEKLL